MSRLFLFITVACCTLVAFRKDNRESKNKMLIEDNFQYARRQLKAMLQETKSNTKSFPRTINETGKLVSTDMYDWTSGFFPGNLWYAYEYTKDTALKTAAIKWTEGLAPLQYFTRHHDLGFMMYCSYGNAYRLTGNNAYKNILVQSAKSLSTRFNPVTGSIKSWNIFKTWHDNKTYNFPVIIDNMMNLELLFFASKITGDTSFRHIAVTHALTAMKNQVRPDYSTYHVVCYDTITGAVTSKETAQGYADNSTWSRGQAWGIYGFTMTYRETKDPRFLATAQKMADWYLSQAELPKDKVPYWDFNTMETGYVPGIKSHAKNVTVKYRDASAAAITASALFELSTYAGRNSKTYYKAAVQMLESLTGPAYKALPGTNGNFLLMHSVGSIPHNSEIDVPLVYADYYLLEALMRYNRLLQGKNILSGV
jgi:chondroitin AC lyase